MADRKILTSGYKRLSDLQDCRELAKQIGELLPPSAVVCLSGPMGAGKTQLIRFILADLGYSDVSSPTFALQNHYSTLSKNVVHFDLHRIEDADELETSGLWESFEAEAWVFIEWAERISNNDLPRDWPILSVQISANRDAEWVLYAACDFE